MQMRSAIQIQSMIKAMMDVVLPAVDPGNKLAQEQSRLIIGMLSMMAKQLPLQTAFDLRDLSDLLAFARQVPKWVTAASATKAALADLSSEVGEATVVLERVMSRPEMAVDMIHRVRAAVCSVLVAVSKDGNVPESKRLERATLDYSKSQLLRDRAWVVMQGFEPSPQSIPAIENLLAQPDAPSGLAP